MLLYQVDELLAADNLCDSTLCSAIEDLARTHGAQAYQALIKNLFQLDLTVDSSRNYWRSALRAQEKSFPPLSIRTALLEQLHIQSNLLIDPRIIEGAKLQSLQRQAMTDGLTSLYNQSYFKQQLMLQVCAAEERPGSLFSLLLFDLDYFKQYNDRCGHLHGDQALGQVGQILWDLLPETSLAARYGGEEFAVLLPDVDLAEAIQIGDKIRAAVEDWAFYGEERLDKGRLTISGGIAVFPQDGKSPVALIAHADSKLYEAKKSRNQVLPSVSNARQITRHAIRNLVEIYDQREGTFKPSLSSDISHVGMLMQSNIATDVGTELTLRFPFPFWPSEHSAEVQVRHIQSQKTHGAFLIGVEFKQPQIEFVEHILPAHLYAHSA